MYEASLVFICSANKAWCKKHIVPSRSNHTTSLNLSMVNEALKQGPTPSLKMCCLQQFVNNSKRRAGGEVAANPSLTRTINWESSNAYNQAMPFLQAAAIKGISCLLALLLLEKPTKTPAPQPLRFCCSCCTDRKSQHSSRVPPVCPLPTSTLIFCQQGGGCKTYCPSAEVLLVTPECLCL